MSNEGTSRIVASGAANAANAVPAHAVIPILLSPQPPPRTTIAATTSTTNNTHTNGGSNKSATPTSNSTTTTSTTTTGAQILETTNNNKRDSVSNVYNRDSDSNGAGVSRELGDIVRPIETKFALSIYLRAHVHQKVIQCFVELGQIDQIVAYVKRVGYQADYSQLLQNMVATNPEGATNFAKSLLEGQNGVPLIDINQVVKVFMDQNRLQETTSIMLDALKANKPEQGSLQTQLLAMNLQQAPKVAEAILQMNMFTHYDRAYIGQLCEKAGLMQWAMEHYTDSADLKRVMMHAHQMTPEFLIQYFSRLSPETALECLTDLMRHNRQNLQVAVKVAIQYHEQIGAVKIVEMFESFGSNEGAACLC
ncbi:CLTC [Symbiodinium sp. CCMP2592]|nr:CLTC [Symbiodinium sp. CCMP2592]